MAIGVRKTLKWADETEEEEVADEEDTETANEEDMEKDEVPHRTHANPSEEWCQRLEERLTEAMKGRVRQEVVRRTGDIA